MADKPENPEISDTPSTREATAEGEPSRPTPAGGSSKKEAEKPEGKGLALFDFDGTLIKEDTLQMFIVAVVGHKWRAYAALLWAMVTAFVESVMTTDDYMDYKSAFKAHWMRATLKGLAVSDAERIAHDVSQRMTWNKDVLQQLKSYADKGYEVVVATGALDVYMKVILTSLPVKVMVATGAEVKDGKLTGRMTGVKRRCNAVRYEKQERVQEYIKENGPYHWIVGYGNMPSDGPMLSLCDEFYIV